MNDNQLGKNIQHLREINGETLEEIGGTVGFARSTIKGYENGSRKPDPDTLRAFAKHYGKTVDELLHTDLTGLDKVHINVNSVFTMMDLYKKLMPLFSSKKTMANKNFKRGYDLCQQILIAFANGDMLRGSIITDVFQVYLKAMEETKEPEAFANLLWCIFLWWTQIFDTENMITLQFKLLSKRFDIMEYRKAKQSESPEVQEKKQSFISDFNTIINETIKALKSDIEWSDLADYYLALRYVIALVETELTVEMNSAVGMQMMLSFAQLENKYALTFLEATITV